MTDSGMKLYTYFRSSAAWRVRIALVWKGLLHSAIPVHLLKDGGQQRAADYLAVNPQGLVPTLVDGDLTLSQSLAICEYLEEKYPQAPLLPSDLAERARARAMALTIAADIHPLNNLRVLQYLKGPLAQEQSAVDAWIAHWIAAGFAAIEAQLEQMDSQQYCVAGQLSLADLCLVPQVFNARRFKVDMTPYPRIVSIDAHLMSLPAFADTQPVRQSDAE
ncbi:maleylacetoacetate isomerase [Chitinimonas sp.]|uniref:maleylacetoacetate isomerase n=1 Tax=Chitinimonas sp. TaxID=1934313 RepID=UPI0035AD93C8